MMRWRLAVWLLGASYSVSSLAFAQPPQAAADPAQAGAQRPSAQATASAAQLAELGELARRLGEYGAAIQAFKQAHQLQPRPRLLFAIADAYHQRFEVAHAAYHHGLATIYYRSYLEAAGDAPTRARAVEALAQLGASEATASEQQLSDAAAAERAATRLAVTSQALGAVARIDGGPPRALPLFMPISAANHRVLVRAEGYLVEEKEVTTSYGSIAYLTADLRPQPAKLSVSTAMDATLYLDGRFMGVAPLVAPMEVNPGMHQLQIALNGHELASQQLSLKRGDAAQIEVPLSLTNRRIGAAVALAVGGVGVAAGVVCGAISTVTNIEIGSTFDDANRRALEEKRDDFRTASLVTVGLGAGISLFGGILWVFDEPAITLSPQGPGDVGGSLTVNF